MRPRTPPSKQASLLAQIDCSGAQPELPVPDLQAQQAPEQLLVVLSACRVLLDVTAQHVRTIVVAGAGAGSQQVIGQVAAHAAAEPLVDRHPEADLRPLEDRRR